MLSRRASAAGWRRLADGSVSVRVWRQAVSSAVAVTRAPADSAVVRIARRFSPHPADAAIPAVADSRLCRTVDSMLGLWSHGWHASMVRRALHRVDAVRPEPRLRLGAAMVLGATVTHVAMVGIDYLVQTPGSGFGWIGAAVAAAVCLVRPDAVLAAWAGSRRFRLK